MISLIVLIIPLFTACQSPCERPLAPGYTRHIPKTGAASFRFDYPSDWKMEDDHTLEKPDASGKSRTVLVQFYSGGIEKYPHIYQDGKILTGQDWGSPFPGRSMEISTHKLDQDGHPGLTVAFDFDTPQTLMDGSSPVTAWGYMQFTFLVIEDTMVDIRFYASDQGEEKRIRKEFEKLIESICVPIQSGGADE